MPHFKNTKSGEHAKNIALHFTKSQKAMEIIPQFLIEYQKQKITRERIASRKIQEEQLKEEESQNFIPEQ